jgi:hypothetical protein
MPKRKPKAKQPETEAPAPVSNPARWHKSIASVAGELSLAIVRRKMTKGEVRGWAARLRETVEEMESASAS